MLFLIIQSVLIAAFLWLLITLISILEKKTVEVKVVLYDRYILIPPPPDNATDRTASNDY